MPLQYDDLAEYLGDVPEDQRYGQFQIFADLYHAMVRTLFVGGPASNNLGIRLQGNSLALAGPVESQKCRHPFNAAAGAKPARKSKP
ncbi:hypothetical protein J3E64_002599 [Sphingobium sp. OAS761]|nr:hypothetical protein [Sphingobium sp. OAS761]